MHVIYCVVLNNELMIDVFSQTLESLQEFSRVFRMCFGKRSKTAFWLVSSNKWSDAISSGNQLLWCSYRASIFVPGLVNIYWSRGVAENSGIDPRIHCSNAGLGWLLYTWRCFIEMVSIVSFCKRVEYKIEKIYFISGGRFRDICFQPQKIQTRTDKSIATTRKIQKTDLFHRSVMFSLTIHWQGGLCHQIQHQHQQGLRVFLTSAASVLDLLQTLAKRSKSCSATFRHTKRCLDSALITTFFSGLAFAECI